MRIIKIKYGYCACGCGRKTELYKAGDLVDEPMPYIKGHEPNDKRYKKFLSLKTKHNYG